MGQGLVDFVLGAAVIVAPSHQLPVALGAGLLKAGSSVIQHRSQKRAALAISEAGKTADSKMLLEWDQLSCSLKKKDGSRKDILHGLSGAAQPGRSSQRSLSQLLQIVSESCFW